MIRKFSLIVLLLLPLISLTADEPGKKFRLAFNALVSDTSADYDVFSMNFAGGERKNITNNPDFAWVYYAYKNRIYFISDRDTCYRCYFLYEMDINGENLRKVTELQLEDSWMSSRNEGSEMIVAAKIGKTIRNQLFLVDVKTGNYRMITNDTPALHRDPSFSPDGKSVVFTYKKNKRDPQLLEELFVMDIESGAMKQITQYPQDDTLRSSRGYKAGTPKWHPSGEFITYQSLQEGKYSIYSIKPDGSGKRKLMNNETYEGYHSWSSDGKYLVFDGFDRDQTLFDIYILEYGTGEIVKLSNSEYKYQQAAVFVEVIP